MTLLRLFLALFWSWSAGYMILALVLGSKLRSQFPFLLKNVLGFGLGLGLSSLHYFLWRVLLDEPGTALVLSEFGIWVLLLLWFFSRERPNFRLLLKDRPSIRIPGISLLALIFGSAVLLAAVISVLGFLKTPQGAWDAWMIWNMKARFLFRGEGFWRNMFFPGVPHPDYPLLLSASIARIWTWLGKEARSVSALIGLFYSIGIPLLLASGLSKMKGKQVGYLAGLTVLISPAYITQSYSQYADIPLAFYMTAAMLLLVWSGQEPSMAPRLWLLAGIFSTLCAWTKNEGWLFLVVIVFIYLVVPVFRKPGAQHWQQLRWFLLGLGPILLVLIYHKFSLAPANDLINPAALDSAGKLLEVERYRAIIGAFIRKMFPLTIKNANPYFILLIIPVFFGFKFNLLKKSWMARPILTVLAILLGYAVIYLITPLELQFHLDASLNRLYLHIWPISIFLVYLLVNPIPPDDLLEAHPQADSRYI